MMPRHVMFGVTVKFWAINKFLGRIYWEAQF
jgi:hypothetical protein